MAETICPDHAELHCDTPQSLHSNIGQAVHSKICDSCRQRLGHRCREHGLLYKELQEFTPGVNISFSQGDDHVRLRCRTASEREAWLVAALASSQAVDAFSTVDLPRASPTAPQVRATMQTCPVRLRTPFQREPSFYLPPSSAAAATAASARTSAPLLSDPASRAGQI